MSTFSIICWSAAAVITSYNIFVWGYPLPRSKKKIEALRARAFEKVSQSSEDDFQKELDRNRVRDEKRDDALLLYSRFADKYKTIDLKQLCPTLRLQRINLRTFLSVSNLEEKHLECFMKFDPYLTSSGNGPNGVKNRQDLERTMVYAMGHLDEADDLLAVVRERGVLELKQVKKLVQEIKDSPATALSDGML